MYKDKEKQRKAVKMATRRYRKGITKVSQDKGITEVSPPFLDRVSHAEYKHQVYCNAPSFVRPFAKGVNCSCRKPESKHKEQSHNPMMVGYVPPEAE